MVSSKFASFSVRPPTPPKDPKELDTEITEVLELLDDPFGTKSLPDTAPKAKTLPILSTPEQSPASETGLSSVSSSARKKRVNFELQTRTNAKDSGLLAEQPWTPRHSSPLRPLPQTRAHKPLKSILKPSDPTSTPPPADEGAAAHNFENVAEMLESVVKMLAQGQRSSKLDAYIALQRTMAAYDMFPDTDALSNKMGLLTHFIRRDMLAVSISGSGPDTQLVQQAVRLLMVLVRIPEVRPAMDDDFCSFLIDRSIIVAADPAMPKAVINCHLALLMQQNFRQKIMTAARAEKILDVLGTIHERVTGYSVQAYRIRVYKKLTQQRQDVMIKHTERWFKFLFKAMLSIQKDINQSALETAVSAAKTFGPNPHVTKAVLSLLNRVKGDGDTWGKIIAQELGKLLATDYALLVPQIWGAVTAFLQESLLDIDKFTALREWLSVFHDILNSTNDAVRHNANIAFTFLIYAVDITESTPAKWSETLLKVPQGQLQAQQQWPRSQARKSDVDTVTSGYLTLIYYAFGRPSASQEQANRYWQEYVADFWKPLLDSPSSHRNALAACRVVSALLKGSRKPWNRYRALELKPQDMVQRAELPLLDPKWVRKSLATLLQFVEILLDTTPWTSDLADNNPVKGMWTALLDSLVEASSKEVTATSEAKDAIAHIVNMLRRMWEAHTAKLALTQHDEDTWADKFCFLIETVVMKLGPLQFADKCLTRNVQDEFEVASTPSHRSRHQGSRISPLLYFVNLLVSRSEGMLADPVRLRVVELILGPCLGVQNTRLTKLELLKDCSNAMEPSPTSLVAANFWNRIGALTKSCMEEQPSDANEREALRHGKEYELVVEILENGSSYFLTDPCGWDLLSAFADTVRREVGHGAVVLAVMERVSGSLLTRVRREESRACLPYATILLSNFRDSINRRTFEQDRQRLYPSSPAPGRHTDFEPYSYFYTAIVSIGAAAYDTLDVAKAEDTRQFLGALADSIGRSSVPILAGYLRKIQPCIKLWVEDSDKKLQTQQQPIKQIHQEVVKLWQAVCEAVQKLPKRDNSTLATLELLLTAGFTSRRRAIVSISTTTWNATFGKEEGLKYPERLEQALLRLRNAVDISTPSMRARREESGAEVTFYDSDNINENVARKKSTPRSKDSLFRISRSARKTQSPAAFSARSKRQSSRQTPKIRLRHDNSQIEFEPIASSPTNPFNQESQILTERQKEMIERQKLTEKIFSSNSFHGDSQEADTSIAQLPSSQLAINADDVTIGDAQTPLKAIAAMAMDVYLGSSPTPHARNRSRHILSDATSIATPSAARTVQLEEDLGSSPPRFEKESGSNLGISSDNVSRDNVRDSFDYRQPDRSYSISFDEGTTINDDLYPDGGVSEGTGEPENLDGDLPNEVNSTYPLGSTVQDELDAQLSADMNARNGVSVVEDPNPQSEVEELSSKSTRTREGTEDSDTSRVGDSFSSTTNPEPPNGSQPSSREVRWLLRNSNPPTPEQPVKRKRGRPPGSAPAKNKRAKKEDVRVESPLPVPSTQHEETTAIDLAPTVPLSPATSIMSKRKRKRSGSKSQSPLSSQSSSQSVIPETTRKRSLARSTSLLNQVENTDDVVEETPAPKRARKSISKDVSEAKDNTSQEPQPPLSARAKRRVSHVQVTPKHRDIATGDEASTPVDLPTSEDELATPARQSRNEIAATPRRECHAIKTSDTPKQDSFAQRIFKTPRSLLEKLRVLKDHLGGMMLGREEEKEFDDVLFDLRREVHAAGRRGEEQQQKQLE